MARMSLLFRRISPAGGLRIGSRGAGRFCFLQTDVLCVAAQVIALLLGDTVIRFCAGFARLLPGFVGVLVARVQVGSRGFPVTLRLGQADVLCIARQRAATLARALVFGFDRVLGPFVFFLRELRENDIGIERDQRSPHRHNELAHDPSFIKSAVTFYRERHAL